MGQNLPTNLPRPLDSCPARPAPPQLTLDPLAELVQALQGAAVAELGRRLRCPLQSGHREGLLQGHHDLIHLTEEGTTQRADSPFKVIGQRFQDSVGRPSTEDSSGLLVTG